jgi:hypothetical protein
MSNYFVDARSLTLTLSQRERGFIPFSLWEKGGDGVALGHEGQRVDNVTAVRFASELE